MFFAYLLSSCGHGASHLRRHLESRAAPLIAPLHSAALSAVFGAAPMLRADLWLTFVTSCAGVVLDSTLEHSILASFNNREQACSR